MSNYEVIEFIKNGNIHPIPSSCPNEMYVYIKGYLKKKFLFLLQIILDF